jgi:hypothetical protein
MTMGATGPGISYRIDAVEDGCQKKCQPHSRFGIGKEYNYCFHTCSIKVYKKLIREYAKLKSDCRVADDPQKCKDNIDKKINKLKDKMADSILKIKEIKGFK